MFTIESLNAYIKPERVERGGEETILIIATYQFIGSRMRKIKFLDRGLHQGLCYTTVEIVYNATSTRFKEYQGRFNIRYSATLLLNGL